MAAYQAILVALIVTAVLTPIHIHIFMKLGKYGEDRHKLHRPHVPEMGGIAVFAGIVAGYAVLSQTTDVPHLPIALAAIGIVFFIGVLDDVVALRQRTKLLLLLCSGIPFYFADGLKLSVFGIAFPVGLPMLALILVGMAAASNLTNILEGFNGESSGLGIIAAGSLCVAGHLAGVSELCIYLLPLIGSLVAFLWYNKYPAKVFPGDTGTLLIGGSVAIATILTDTVVLGVIVLLPQIVEFLLKSRVRFGGVSYGPTIVDDAGILTPPPSRSIANILTSRYRLTEPKLVVLIWGFGAVCGCISIIAALLLY
jgi:UDP-N-acetylglucosamine--dolichyl-phosphate N-acetylglucosaminephosphotransferase